MPDQIDLPSVQLVSTSRVAYAHWRHAVVPAMIAEGDLAGAAELLGILCRSPLSGPRDRLERARLLNEADDPGAVDALAGLVAEGADANIMAFGLSRLLLRQENECAAALAANWRTWPQDDRLQTLAAKALARGGMREEVAAMTDAQAMPTSPAEAVARMRLLNEAGHYDEAIALAGQARAGGADSAALRVELADALERSDRHAEALTAYDAAVAQDPRQVRAVLRRGELHLSLGNGEAAIADLSLALQLAPHLNKARVALGRAFKAAGDYEQAADLFVEALALEPANESIRKLAVAGLNQAGRNNEAIAIYDSLVEKRDEGLPDDLVKGMEDLWDASARLSLPQGRMDWAWSLRDADAWSDREEWEARAKWGALADKLLYNWLECRTDRVEEALPLIEDLDAAGRTLQPLLDRGKGLIVASGHIGLMFAGPLALELLGYDNKWLASVPSIPTLGFADQLISTVDQTEAQVVRQSMRALSEGKVLTVAIDGAMSMDAPRVEFEGQMITYSSFAARLSFKQKAPSVWAKPRWKDGRIEFDLAHMPDPERARDLDEFLDAWREAFLGHLRNAMRDAPENLRLSGGLWRDVV
ncbi:tetratricopeptide repeat protein [Sphingomicrobium nitratireducens]|uniref:tetratricopeptide repeat protein n=1 Tax=Sphingomicrobium nitratireducens TaxID=2964666 RepID=UPI00223E93BD|nr:tetratricopeptide repeat protein [Sphingomicrobium nitratireducens]